MACYGVFTGAREFAYRASVTSPLAGFGYSRLAISPGADLRDNGDHSYGKPGGGCLPVIRSSLLLVKLYHFLRVYESFWISFFIFFTYVHIYELLIIRELLHIWFQEKRETFLIISWLENTILNLHLIYTFAWNENLKKHFYMILYKEILYKTKKNLFKFMKFAIIYQLCNEEI